MAGEHPIGIKLSWVQQPVNCLNLPYFFATLYHIGCRTSTKANSRLCCWKRISTAQIFLLELKKVVIFN